MGATALALALSAAFLHAIWNLLLRGRVDNVEYCGRDSLVDIVLGDGTRVHVRTNASVELGQELHVVVPPERVLVYPSEQ